MISGIELWINGLACLAAAFFFRILPLAYKVAGVQVFAGIATELLGKFYFHGANFLFYKYYLLADCSLLIISGFLLQPAKKLRIILFSCFSFFLLTWFFRSGDNFTDFIIAYVTESVIVFILYINVLYRLATSYKGELRKCAGFFLATGIVIFYGCSIPYFASLPGAIKYLNNSELDSLNITHDIISMIRYLLALWSFCLAAKFNKTPDHAA